MYHEQNTKIKKTYKTLKYDSKKGNDSHLSIHILCCVHGQTSNPFSSNPGQLTMSVTHLQ